MIEMTQAELDELIQKRVARVRQEYTDEGHDALKADSRRWESRAKQNLAALKEVEQDRDNWKTRAKMNVGQIRALENMNRDLLNRLEGIDG